MKSEILRTERDVPHAFAKNHCASCPLKGHCKAKEQAKNYVVHVSQKMAERTSYLLKMITDEYLKLARGEIFSYLRNTIFKAESWIFSKKRLDFV